MTNYFPTVIFSNFPGPPPECFSFGFPMVDTIFTGGPLRGNIGNSMNKILCNLVIIYLSNVVFLNTLCFFFVFQAYQFAF